MKASWGWGVRSVVLASLMAVACKSGGGAAPVVNEAPTSSQPAAAPAPEAAPELSSEPLSNEALWELAPREARFAFVMSPRGVEWVERILSRLGGLAPYWKGSSELELLIARAMILPEHFTLRNLGLTTEKPLALFGAGESALMVLPVGDRQRLATVLNGRREGEVDQFGEVRCKAERGLYVCAWGQASSWQLGGGDLGAMYASTKVGRGELEILGEAESPKVLTMAADLGVGTFTFRGALMNMSPHETRLFGDLGLAELNDTHTGLLLVDTRPLYADMSSASSWLGNKVFDRMMRSIGGPLHATSQVGDWRFEGAVPLVDAAAYASFFRRCDREPGFEKIAKTSNGVCRLNVPVSTSALFSLDLWVDGKMLRFGQRGAAAPKRLPATPLRQALSGRRWSFAMWGRGIGGSPMPMIPMQDAAEQRAQDQLRPELARGVLLVNEIGVGITVEPQGDQRTVRFTGGVRTLFANPDDVVTKVLAISDEELASGRGDARLKEIAAAAPGSPLAGDVEAGLSSFIFPATILAAALPKVRAQMQGAPTSTP